MYESSLVSKLSRQCWLSPPYYSALPIMYPYPCIWRFSYNEKRAVIKCNVLNVIQFSATAVVHVDYQSSSWVITTADLVFWVAPRSFGMENANTWEDSSEAPFSVGGQPENCLSSQSTIYDWLESGGGGSGVSKYIWAEGHWVSMFCCSSVYSMGFLCPILPSTQTKYN